MVTLTININLAVVGFILGCLSFLIGVFILGFNLENQFKHDTLMASIGIALVWFIPFIIFEVFHVF